MYAQHISYDLSGVAVAPFSASGIDNVLAAIMDNAVPANHGFTITTDKAGSAGITTGAPNSLRSLLGDSEGCVLDIYGGEYRYDRFSISLLNKRGQKRDFVIRYGQNMTSFEQEENCSAVYTDVYPYWISGEESVFLDEKTVRASGTYDFTRVLPLDMSSYFESRPTKDDLKAAAENYMATNNIGVPRISLKLSYEDFAENQNEPIGLCDSVTVVFPKLNVNTEAQIVRVEYDVLLERYKSLEIGSTVSRLADTIADNTVDISEILSAPSLQQAIANATAWLTRSTGGYIVFKRNDEGALSEILIMDRPDEETAEKVWRWNSGGLGFSANGVNGPYETAITQDGSIVGRFVTAEGLAVDAASVSGKLIAEQVDATDLVVNAAKISGKLSADQIDVENLKVTSANIDHLYAGDLEVGGGGSGYIASGVISASGSPLSELYLTAGEVETLYVSNTLFLGSRGSTASTYMSEFGITMWANGSPQRYEWADLLGGSGGVAKFG